LPGSSSVSGKTLKREIKPNILFIVTDQQRWDAMGWTGGWVRTPHLDLIARLGLRCTHCMTTAPICVPTRLSLATGRYPHNTEVWHNIGYTLPPTTPTWMQAIREAGYRTSLFGKSHLHPHGSDLRQREPLVRCYGFDDIDETGDPRSHTTTLSRLTSRWQTKGLMAAYKADFADRFAHKQYLVRPSILPLEEYDDVYVGQQAKAYLAAYARPEPWFCWVGFPGPHEPWDAPEPYASMYDPAEMPPALPRPTQHAGRPTGTLDYRLAFNRIPFEPGEIGRLRANYAGKVTLIDDQVGQLLDTIRARGELDRTVIVFTSDHGEMNGDCGLIFKGNFLRSAVQVPLMISTPALRSRGDAGATCSSPVEWLDLGPTLVDLAGGSLRHTQFGESLFPALEHPQMAHRPDALSEFQGEVMLVTPQWKIALNAASRPYLLFDLQQDPNESVNLAGTAAVKDIEMKLSLRILERLVRSQVQLQSGEAWRGRTAAAPHQKKDR
jgi:choline-sulfatase